MPVILQPLSEKAFRMLCCAWLAANVCTVANDVTCAWLMTQRTDNALLVALVQAAAALPVLLLSLPCGALADRLDRQTCFAATQVWTGMVACLLALFSVTGFLQETSLLALTFAGGVSVAMRSPVFSALIPSVVRPDQLTSAIVLSSMSVNISRIAGPMLAGVVLAASGPTALFALNALASVLALAMILGSPVSPQVPRTNSEGFASSIRVGFLYVWRSPRLRTVVAQLCFFFIQTMGLLALLPLIARGLGGGAATFTTMMSFMGAGAVVSAFGLPWLRGRLTPANMWRYATLILSLASTVVALTESLWVALPAMAVAGACWMTIGNYCNVAVQTALPEWVRARGLSIIYMASMGGAAVGAVLWGQVASSTSPGWALLGSACVGPIVVAVVARRQSF